MRAIREKDIATLQSVPRVGKKKAEQLILDLADKLDDLAGSPASGGPRPEGASAEDAIRALVSLGYATVDAEKAVRAALDRWRGEAVRARAHSRGAGEDRRALSGTSRGFSTIASAVASMA